MTDAGWTAEVPKEIGVYWWRSNAADNHPWIVRVHKGWLGLMLMQTMGGPLVTIGDGGEWLGPITPDSYQQGRVEGLREAEKYALRCLKELQDKIRDLESGKCVLAGAQTKEGVEAWVHAKTLEASRIAKWITARIIEQQAQDEKGVGDGKV